MESYEATCGDAGCFQMALNEEHALWTGWRIVEGTLLCPIHWPQVVMKAQRAAQKEQVQRHHHEVQAKHGLTTAEYAKWHEFQQQLTDYHRKTGKLAPGPLRTMNPYQWLYLTKKRGPIDVEAEVQRMEQAEQDHQDRLRRAIG